MEPPPIPLKYPSTRSALNSLFLSSLYHPHPLRSCTVTPSLEHFSLSLLRVWSLLLKVDNLFATHRDLGITIASKACLLEPSRRTKGLFRKNRPVTQVGLAISLALLRRPENWYGQDHHAIIMRFSSLGMNSTDRFIEQAAYRT